MPLPPDGGTIARREEPPRDRRRALGGRGRALRRSGGPLGGLLRRRRGDRRALRGDRRRAFGVLLGLRRRGVELRLGLGRCIHRRLVGDRLLPGLGGRRSHFRFGFLFSGRRQLFSDGRRLGRAFGSRLRVLSRFRRRFDAGVRLRLDGGRRGLRCFVRDGRVRSLRRIGRLLRRGLLRRGLGAIDARLGSLRRLHDYRRSFGLSRR